MDVYSASSVTNYLGTMTPLGVSHEEVRLPGNIVSRTAIPEVAPQDLGFTDVEPTSENKGVIGYPQWMPKQGPYPTGEYHVTQLRFVLDNNRQTDLSFSVVTAMDYTEAVTVGLKEIFKWDPAVFTNDSIKIELNDVILPFTSFKWKGTWDYDETRATLKYVVDFEVPRAFLTRAITRFWVEIIIRAADMEMTKNTSKFRLTSHSMVTLQVGQVVSFEWVPIKSPLGEEPMEVGPDLYDLAERRDRDRRPRRDRMEEDSNAIL